MVGNSASSNEEIKQIYHVSIILSSAIVPSGSSLSICRTCLLLKIGLIPRPCDNGSELLGSRPRVRLGVLALLVQCILVEVVAQLHLASMVCRLLVNQMLHVCVHLELHPLDVSRDGFY